ncbi:MAG: O-antigen ligase family protein [Rhizobiaceae bacterium]|jgi:O-antigen ligase|nr:O-antigen ligase family protein [Rhizobiaceae bacterium]
MRWPTLRQNNTGFNGLYFAGSTLVGSLSSVLLHVALVWALVRIALGTFPLTRSRAALLVAGAMALLPLAEAASVIANGRGVDGWLEVIGQLAFLAVLPVLSRLAVSPPEEVLRDCTLAAAIGGVILLVLALIQFGIVGLLRAEAGLGNAGVMSVVALLLACLALCGIEPAGERRRMLLIVGAACAGGALLLTGMRAVIATAPIAVMLVLLLARGATWRWVLRGPALAVMLVFGIALAAAVPMLVERAAIAANAITQIIETGETEDVSLGQRLDLWRGAVPLIMEKPFFGHGPDAARGLIAAIPATPRMHHSHFHNFAINALVRGGLFELVAMLAIPLALVAVAWRTQATAEARAGRAFLLALPIIFYVPGLTGKLFDHDILNAMFVYAVIVGLRLLDPDTPATRAFRAQA